MEKIGDVIRKVGSGAPRKIKSKRNENILKRLIKKKNSCTKAAIAFEEKTGIKMSRWSVLSYGVNVMKLKYKPARGTPS